MAVVAAAGIPKAAAAGIAEEEELVANIPVAGETDLVDVAALAEEEGKLQRCRKKPPKEVDSLP